MPDSPLGVIGFVGLGVMGAPMCRNLAFKHPGEVLAFDTNEAAFEALTDTPVRRATSLADVGSRADIVFLSLPGGAQVEQVCLDAAGLTSGSRAPQIIVDLSTTTVASARSTGERLAQRGVQFVDAPVARTREAAMRGELSIMVGASEALYARVEPLLKHLGSDLTRCGELGCGQVVKLINNALVFEHTAALAEMMVLGQRAGVEPHTLLEAVSRGSGDSFVLRNHGRKAMLPRQFPPRSFPPGYVLKDLGCVLELARQTGTVTPLTELARRYYATAVAQGQGDRYFPAVIELVERDLGPHLPPEPGACA